MIENLVLGLPGQRPGGLVLTLLFFFGAMVVASVGGLVYAALCVAFPRASLLLQAACAFTRGIPIILLVFLFGQLNAISLSLACLTALSLYSFVHVGEILRGFLGSYPSTACEQARVLGLSLPLDWTRLRLPWTFRHALDVLVTHWISLLKDTGALVVLSVGELTTVAKALSESSVNSAHVATVLLCAAALYLATTLTLVAAFSRLHRLPLAP